MKKIIACILIFTILATLVFTFNLSAETATPHQILNMATAVDFEQDVNLDYYEDGFLVDDGSYLINTPSNQGKAMRYRYNSTQLQAVMDESRQNEYLGANALVFWMSVPNYANPSNDNGAIADLEVSLLNQGERWTLSRSTTEPLNVTYVSDDDKSIDKVPLHIGYSATYLKPKSGFKGWVVIPISYFNNKAWGTSNTSIDLSQRTDFHVMCNWTPADDIGKYVYFDSVGFTKSQSQFVKNVGGVKPVPYVCGLDFENETGTDTENSYSGKAREYIVNGGYTEVLMDTNKQSQYVGSKALVFWMSAPSYDDPNSTGDFDLSLVNNASRWLLSKSPDATKEITFVSDTDKSVTTMPLGYNSAYNNTFFKHPNGFEGWVIIPMDLFSAKAWGSASNWDLSLPVTFQLVSTWSPNNLPYYFDNVGFTKDTDEFLNYIEAVQPSMIPGMDFENSSYGSETPYSYSGKAFEQKMSNQSVQFDIQLEETYLKYKYSNALVFWMNTPDFAEPDAAKNMELAITNNGNRFKLTNTAGVDITYVSDVDKSVTVTPANTNGWFKPLNNFSGWVVIPISALEGVWNSNTINLDYPAQFQLIRGWVPLTDEDKSIYYDQIGFVRDTTAFINSLGVDYSSQAIRYDFEDSNREKLIGSETDTWIDVIDANNAFFMDTTTVTLEGTSGNFSLSTKIKSNIQGAGADIYFRKQNTNAYKLSVEENTVKLINCTNEAVLATISSGIVDGTWHTVKLITFKDNIFIQFDDQTAQIKNSLFSTGSFEITADREIAIDDFNFVLLSTTPFDEYALANLAENVIAAKTEVSDLLKNANSLYPVSVIKNGVTIETGYVGTGMAIYVNGEQMILAVRNDLTGDGMVNVMDLINAKNTIIGKSELTKVQKKATNVSDSMNIIDLLNLKDEVINGDSPAQVEQGVTKISDYVLNEQAWTPPVIDNQRFEVQVLGYSPYNVNTMINSITNLGIGTPTPIEADRNAEEWANTYIHGLNGMNLPTAPSTRQEAVNRLFTYLNDLSQASTNPIKKTINGNYLYMHYAGEAGYDIIGSEIGADIRSYQMGLAFNRGAAKQYQKPWIVDVSPWYNSVSMLDYSGANIWGTTINGVAYNSTPMDGHSLNLLKRAYYISYMSGTSRVIAEAGGCNFFYPTTDIFGNYKLSPLGTVGKEFNNFINRNTDIGIPYTPFGLMIDYYHGTYFGSNQPKKAFETFDYTKGDDLTWTILDMFFPDSWNQWERQEKNAFTSSPYGDSMDVLLQNASQEVINSYPTLIISGNLSLSSDEIIKVENYVSQGGTLVLNTMHLNMFPEFIHSTLNTKYNINYNNGKVYVYGRADQNNPLQSHTDGLNEVLALLTSQYMPFSVSGKVEYITNIKNGSIIVTVINNEGITKAMSQEPIIDLTKTQTVEVKYKGASSVKWVKNLRSGQMMSSHSTQFITLKPGDFAIYEFSI